MSKPSLAANVSLSLPGSSFVNSPSRLIPDAGTEKLAGVLLISGKTRQVPSRRVTVGGRGSKELFSPSISLSLSLSLSCLLCPSHLSNYLPVGDSTTSISDFDFTCGNPLTLRLSLFSSFPFCILVFIGIYLCLLSIIFRYSIISFLL